VGAGRARAKAATIGPVRVTAVPMIGRPTAATQVVLTAGTVALPAVGCGRLSGLPAAQAQAGRHGATTSTTTTSTTQAPVTPISWSPCNGDLQCGTLVVPLDYADPSGPTIPIAVARHPAEDPLPISAHS
jgi:hypothetical protein